MPSLTSPEVKLVVERQPGRPSEDEFTRAAFRFVTSDYQLMQTHEIHGYTTIVCSSPIGKYADAETIRAERHADGRLGEVETIDDFALRQLVAYQRLRKGLFSTSAKKVV